jgi:hypothetical protein
MQLNMLRIFFQTQGGVSARRSSPKLALGFDVSPLRGVAALKTARALGVDVYPLRGAAAFKTAHALGFDVNPLRVVAALPSSKV